MSQYVTEEEVRLVLSRNKDDVAGNAASLDDANMRDQIEEAQTRVDSKLATVYKTPFEPVPTMIRNITRDIAAYLADLTFREFRDYGSELNPVYLRYKDAIKQLDEIAAGKIVIPGNPPPDDGAQAGSNEVVAVFGGELELDYDPYRNRKDYERPVFFGRYE
jgi:phage gp36-like protein